MIWKGSIIGEFSIIYPRCQQKNLSYREVGVDCMLYYSIVNMSLILSKFFFPLISIVGNAVGDFMIYRFIRQYGGPKTLLFICSFSILFTPFVLSDLATLNLALATELFFLSIVTLASALLSYYALGGGKLSVMESVLALELPAIFILNFYFYNDSIDSLQILCLLVIFAGLFLSVTENFKIFHKKLIFEKGFYICLLVLLVTSSCVFFSGSFAKDTSPMFVFWFTHIFMFAAMLIYVTFSNNFLSAISSFKKDWKAIFILGFFDTLGWIGYLYSNQLYSIPVSAALSQMYIPIVVYLGYRLNKESLARHQKIGLAIVVIMIIILAYILV